MLKFCLAKKIYKRATNNMSNKNYSGSAIVCSHVASGKYSILLAERSVPDEAVDTGWQFVCNSGVEENVDTAKVWALDEVLALEPSLRDFIDLPPGTELQRKHHNSPWKIIKKP